VPVHSGLRSLLAAPTSPHETRRVRASCAHPVFGATDGLVANVSLIMGVAGASSGDAHTVVLAGIAGLLGGEASGHGPWGEVHLGAFAARAPRLPGSSSSASSSVHTPDQERAILVEIYEIERPVREAER